MRVVLSILLLLIGALLWMQVAAGQTNGIPPLPAGDQVPYAVDDLGNTNAIPVYPFLLATGVDSNGQVVLEAPPRWMLDGPPAEPSTTTIRLKFYDRLDSNKLYTVDFTCPRDCAFAGWEIVEQ